MNWFNLVQVSLRRPISVIIAIITLVTLSFLALVQVPKDLMPNLGVPTIYVAQPYGGMSAAQMESYVTYYYEYHFLYISGIEHVESKNIQSTALIKLQFHPGTDMAQALAETLSYVNRARAFMPEGLVSPFVMRFDSGSAPFGKLVFSSTDSTRTLPQLQNFALNLVRPLFATLPGVSAPPPFGASQRSIVVTADPNKLRKFNLSATDLVQALSRANRIVPSGNLSADDLYPLVSLKSVVQDIAELKEVPLRLGSSPTVFVKDVASVNDSADIQTGYALVNGKRTVYIPVTKRADASTLSVAELIQKNISRFQSVLPDDVTVSYQFDQSGFIRNSIFSLEFEGILGACLAALMVLLFLRDVRSAIILATLIPIAILIAILLLWLTKQTLNLMTLGGLALAVGLLIDEVTVSMESIHTHLKQGKSIARATLDGANEVLLPVFLSTLCVLAVFLPSFFMTGVAKALFAPLSLAVAFAVFISFVLSRTLLPVLSVWLIKPTSHEAQHSEEPNWYSRLSRLHFKLNSQFLARRKPVLWIYCLITLTIVSLGLNLGREIFPKSESGQMQIRLRAPLGSSIQRTEALSLRFLDLVKNQVEEKNFESSVAFVGMQAPSYPINTIHQWSSGTHESVIEIAFRKGAKISILDLKEILRLRVQKEIPEISIAFETSSFVEKILSQGAAQPIEIVVAGQNLPVSREFAKKIETAISDLPYLRDIHYAQAFETPTFEIAPDRAKAGAMGLSVSDIGQALVPAISSSRFVSPNYWSDPKNGVNYQVQVQVLNSEMKNIEDLGNLPISVGGGAIPLKNFSDIQLKTSLGQYDRYNMQRMVTIRANLAGVDLGKATSDIQKRLSSLEKPKGVDLQLRGQSVALTEVFTGLSIGLLVSILLIFALLAASFESLNLALVVLSTIPATLSGALLFLFCTGSTLNIQSLIGSIMALGVSVANAILLVSFAEKKRKQGLSATESALQASQQRLRPILMTSLAMIFGMLPMASTLFEGSEQTAPLARAVIGGLLASTIAILTVLPTLYSVVMANKTSQGNSLDPNDPESTHFALEKV